MQEAGRGVGGEEEEAVVEEEAKEEEEEEAVVEEEEEAKEGVQELEKEGVQGGEVRRFMQKRRKTGISPRRRLCLFCPPFLSCRRLSLFTVSGAA